MKTSKEDLKNLKNQIVNAFSDVPYPQGIITPHECDECREHRKTFGNKNWKTIELEILEENFSAIALFSPEAFHYFLPAFLVYSLNYFSDNDTVCQYTIYNIAPSSDSFEDRLDYWKERFKNFNGQQMSLICKFLDYADKDENFEASFKEIERGKRNLELFIKPLHPC